MSNYMNHMKAIILAGGRATRLSNSAQDRPKALVEIGGKSILQHQLDLLKKHRIYEVRLSLGFRAEQIIECLKKWKTGRQAVEYMVETAPLGTGGAIKFASRDISGDFLALNGDILTDLDLTNFINYHQKIKQKLGRNLGALAAWKCRDCSDFGFIRHRQGKILEYVEKPGIKIATSNPKPLAGYINAGFYLLNSELFRNEERSVFSVERDIFSNAVKCGNLFAYLFDGLWMDVGTEERLTEAKKRLKEDLPLDNKPETV